MSIGKLKGRHYLSVCGMIIFKRILNKKDESLCTGSSWLRVETTAVIFWPQKLMFDSNRIYVYFQTNTTNRTRYVLSVHCNMFWCAVQQLHSLHKM